MRWKTIANAPNYEVSDQGQVRNRRTLAIHKPMVHCHSGCLFVSIKLHGKFITMNLKPLVWKTFKGTPPHGQQITLLNLDKRDCRLVNMKLMSQGEAILYRNRFRTPNYTRFPRKLTPAEHLWIRQLAARGLSQVKISQIVGCTNGAISRILNGRPVRR